MHAILTCFDGQVPGDGLPLCHPKQPHQVLNMQSPAEVHAAG